MAVISHQLDAESSVAAERELQQSKAPVSPPDTVVEEAKCEDLEKLVIGDTSEKFFQVGA